MAIFQGVLLFRFQIFYLALGLWGLLQSENPLPIEMMLTTNILSLILDIIVLSVSFPTSKWSTHIHFLLLEWDIHYSQVWQGYRSILDITQSFFLSPIIFIKMGVLLISSPVECVFWTCSSNHSVPFLFTASYKKEVNICSCIKCPTTA